MAHRSPPRRLLFLVDAACQRDWSRSNASDAPGVTEMLQVNIVALTELALTRPAGGWATLVPGINHESADKPTGLAGSFTPSLRVLFDLQCLIEVNQPDGAPPDVDVKWAAWRISEFLSPPTGLIHSEPLS